MSENHMGPEQPRHTGANSAVPRANESPNSAENVTASGQTPGYPGGAQPFAGPATFGTAQPSATPADYQSPGGFPAQDGSQPPGDHPAQGDYPPRAQHGGDAAQGEGPPHQATWGAAPAAWPATNPPTGTKWKPWKKVAAGAAIAAVVAVGGVAAVTAANASGDTGSAQAAASGGGPGMNGIGGNGIAGAGYGPDGSGLGGPGAGMGARGGAMGLAGALHGEFVVETQDGTIQTRRLQKGEVTAVSAGSLAVASTDGFSATYVIGSDLDVSALAVGDPVRVIATVDGSTLTATAVHSGAEGLPGGRDHDLDEGGRPGGTGDLTPPSDAQVTPQTS